MRKSVVAAIQFEDQLFYIKRSEKLSVFPGYLSFVGGKVDRGENLKEALYREIHEELGLNLNDSIVESIEPWAIAITPDFNPYRFETHFYRVVVNKRPDFIFNGEIKEGLWLSHKEFYKLFDQGEIITIPPIKILTDKINSPEFLGHLEIDFDNEIPILESLKNLFVLFPRSNTFPPASRTNCFVIGKEDSIIVDPSPCDENEYGKLKRLLAQFKPRSIFLTHHHRDHIEKANLLAKEFNIPIYSSLDTKERIEKRWNANYFDEITWKEAFEGMKLGEWLGEELHVVAVPGHDEGQLMIMDSKKRFAIVSDLIQTIGTVVVGDEEGDMTKYFLSMEKVISLNPKVIFPSHGIGLGGVWKIKQTLSHRKQREKVIKELYLEGRSEDEILAIIYADLPKELIKYAKKTISCHLDRIKTLL
ncbi:MBL fold metallo-hydrolase [Halobacteriovorax sp. GB3]|uniref:MBL fold metallo-hydrolase n=1 Tax=Halobacteriovorax sp. GB3 TaxID=2719615 RepID=UPI002362BEA8|nr:MBL fold metallo-hydrolase [Halobacteriovorax sp. GB3]MDD0853338.1 MBL fold metallo-hydrolase [Halobacteriovorax sp. GB3]